MNISDLKIGQRILITAIGCDDAFYEQGINVEIEAAESVYSLFRPRTRGCLFMFWIYFSISSCIYTPRG